MFPQAVSVMVFLIASLVTETPYISFKFPLSASWSSVRVYRTHLNSDDTMGQTLLTL